MLPTADAAIDRVRVLLVSPNLIDLILVFTVIEAIILALWRRRTRRGGLSGAAVGGMLLPGVFLLLAVRAALSQAAWPWVPAALAASLIAHLLDLRARWQRQAGPLSPSAGRCHTSRPMN